MRKLNLNVKNLNNCRTSHLEESNWAVSEETREKSRFNNDYCGFENGFKLLVGRFQVTIWNGSKRIYIPLIGFNLKDSNKNKEWVKKRLNHDKTFDRLSENLAPLNINTDQLLDLLLFYLVDLNHNDNDLLLFMEGDLTKELKLKNLSISNYVYSYPYGNKDQKGLICYDFIENEYVDEESIQQMIKQTTESSEKLFKMRYMKEMNYFSVLD